MSWMMDEILARGGSVPFDVFMELALYHPEHGYYSSDEPRYGRGGDYLTAPTASEWYPRTIARLLRVAAGDLGTMRLVDVASGDGSLIKGVFDALGSSADAVVAEVVSVERSQSMRSRQSEVLSRVPTRVTWSQSSDEVEPTLKPTVIHASELFDAQPVVRVVGRSGGFREIWVSADEIGLGWQERPPREAVVEYFSSHQVEIAEGQIAEANLDAEVKHQELLKTAAAHGLLLVLDYGYEARRLYNPRGRRGGSLATFRRHEVGRDPLESPGQVDLTAHVNWDDLRRAAAGEGWSEIGLVPLAEFLIRAGLADELDRRGFGMEAELDAETFTVRQEVKRLLDPEGMGSDLKMLIQAKGSMIDTARTMFALNSEFGIRNSEFPPAPP
jgi:SAM-dependent MidA family methyltransferase